MMLQRLCDFIAPANSRRRLLGNLLVRACRQPRDYLRFINSSSIRYFINYLRAASPELVERMVDEVLAQEKSSADAADKINHLLPDLVLSAPRPVAPARNIPVDIIVPVYNAPELTVACLNSVLANSENCRVIVVNDASTDAAVRPLLDGLKDVPERKIELLVRHNDRNLGFVKTVNDAYLLTTGHFVVLNSDTEVPPGWLDRLFAPIFADPSRVASVTPFSNAAMGCSFPVPDQDNPLFKGLPHDQIDAILRASAPVEPVEIFTGVGFCLAFNRNAVEQIGLFDEDTFGRGYGEESDWCLRAFDAGYKNVLVSNLFVYHKHGGSFSAAEKSALQKRNLDRFWEKHRRHLPRQHEFHVKNSIREVREALVAAVDAATKGNEKRVLILDVDFIGGGTVYSAALEAQLRKAGFGLVHARYNSRHEYLKLQVDNSFFNSSFVLPRSAADNIPALLAFYRVDFIVVNELFWWPDPPKILQQLAGGQLPYMVLIHDYFMLCPSWLLMNQKSEFCTLPEDEAVCRDCLAANTASLHRKIYGNSLGDVGDWRNLARRFLHQATKVICFSPSSSALVSKVYPDLGNVEVLEHAIPERKLFAWQQRSFGGQKSLRIGIIGSLFTTKGEDIVKELIQSPKFKSLPIQLVVFGLCPLYPSGYRSPDGKITFLGGYRHGELPKLLQAEEINAVLIPSICAETFSYTTSEAMLLGYPVLCFDLGAPADRVRKYDAGIVMEEISIDCIVSAMQELLSHPELVAQFSSNACNYEPVSATSHFGHITGTIAVAMGEASSKATVEELSGLDTAEGR